MNLALHGFLLQVILSILNFKHGFRLCSAGEPGYLDFDNLPETNFSCQGKVIGGYYADVEAGCQMFHVCTIGQKDEIMDIKFLCLNGTVFDQETRVCERVDEVDCSKSERFYNLNLELYGNNAVTLSLHEEEDDDESTEPRDDHQQQQQHHMTSARPSTTSTTTTTTSRPSQQSTSSASNVYQQHPTGYPQHYQPRPAFPSIQTSQSNTHYDDKNGGYHHQYIFHNDERNNNNQATSYQLFSNQGVSSTTPTPQVHQQVRYSSTASPQVIHNEPSTVTPLQYHVQSTSSTIQTLLNSNANNPSLINPLFHNHGIASTTEQFNVHNNNPREIAEYQDNSEDDEQQQDDGGEQEEREERRPLEPVQSTNKGKVSKLTISPIPQQENRPSVIQTKSSQSSSQQQRISINYLPTPSPIQTTISAFYPTQRPAAPQQKPQKPQQNNLLVTQHIHVPPPPSIPQLKPHQITINLPPPDIQRIVQNPSPLLPSQSRVIVTAKASVSDESGRPLNASQLITLPLPTIPSNYDDYKEGDESFDPFYRDVPKIRNNRRIVVSRKVEESESNSRKKRSANYEDKEESYPSEEVIFNAEIKDIKDLKANLPIIKAILFGLPIPEKEEPVPDSENTTVESTDTNNSRKNLHVWNESNRDVAVTSNEKISNKNTNNTENVEFLEDEFAEEEYVDEETPEIPKSVEKPSKVTNNAQIPIVVPKLQEQISAPIIEHKKRFNPTVIKSDAIDPEPKDTVQLFLRAVEGNNSLSNNSSHQIESLNSPLNETTGIKSKADNVRHELLQTRSSSNGNKSNRRKFHEGESLEESEEYLPRRNSRVNKPKSRRYYDEYDVIESTELNSRQRSNRLRSRPSNRRVTKYRDDYVDEELDEEEYEDENPNRNRKSSQRRGPKNRRLPYRSRNRHFDYEEDEVDEKPRARTKALTAPSRSRSKAQPDRAFEDKRRRTEGERRKNGRKRPPVNEEDIPLASKTDIKSQIFEEVDAKSTKDIGSPGILQEEQRLTKYSLKNEAQKPHQLGKKRFNSLERDEESIEQQREQNKEDYLDEGDAYLDEYNESEEGDLPEDYVEYTDPISEIDNSKERRLKNIFDVVLPPVKSHRQDKSHKFTEEVKVEKVEEKIEYEDYESTTLPDDQDTRTTNLPLEYTDEATASQESDDYNSAKVIPKKEEETTKAPQLPKATEDVSTEGVFKFTDELPRSEKKHEVQENDKQKIKLTPNEEDYVDDNYEPDSYTDTKIKQPLSSLFKSKEENNKHVFTVNDEAKDIKITNNNRTMNASDVKSESKGEYDDEIYEDRLESTTVLPTSEEYDDTETTTDVTFITTTSATTTTTTVSTTTSTSTTTTPNPVTTTTANTVITTTPSPPTTTASMIPRTKTSSKFFKPIAFRKTYAYVPPSTTPSPVIIRRGQPLSGPKPTKPPPSYNELAPKPIIRRLPLLSRTTTTTSEATILEDKIATELSKHLSKETNETSEENDSTVSNLKNIPTSVLETVTTHPFSSKFSSTLRSRYNDVTTEDFASTTLTSNNENVTPEPTSTMSTRNNQQSTERFDNEVPKQSPNSDESNNVPQKVEDSVAETSKAEMESTTFNEEDSMKVETTTKNVHSSTTTKNFKPSERRKLELTSVKSQIQKINQGPKRQSAGFNCLEKEMYRFYGDVRDCRLFHYCSPGFTSRQVLDFRFVCEEGTIFDEDSQSCRHDVPNPKCVKRTW